MSTNKNVKSENTKNPKAWLFFALLSLLSLVFTVNVAPKYGVILIVLSSVFCSGCIVLAVCLYIAKWTFKDMIFGTEEERRKREEKKAAKQQVSDDNEESNAEDEAPEQPGEDLEDEESDEDLEGEEPEQTAEEAREPETPANAKAWNGYNIGDVFVSVPASCIGNYIGAVADAIKQGKVELAHGLILDDSNVVKISLKEMIKFGYKAPSGYKIDAKHDTLVALPGKMNYVGNGKFEVDVPDGFILIDKGEHAGEMVPNSMELIKGL